MSEKNVIESMYQQIRQIKQTKRKNIVLLKNRSSGQYSVAKIQLRQEDSNQQRTVRHEGKFFLQMQGHIGIPLMRWVGKDGMYDVIILEKLGQTIEQLFKNCGSTFSLSTITMLGLRMLKILQNYHQKGYIHKHLTPKDFQMGTNANVLKIYLNDLMDSQSYLNKEGNNHIEHKNNCRVGELNMFMSAQQMKGEQPSRKTDIQAIITMLIYFSTGKLPWQDILNEDIGHQQKVKKVTKIMKQTTMEKLCAKLPRQFGRMLTKARNTGFTEEPNYYYYEQQILRIMYHHNIINNQIYDWIIKTNPLTKLTPETKRLKIDKVSPNLDISICPYEEQFLNTFYKPYEDELEIDEISNKYQRHVQKKQLEQSKLYQDEEPPLNKTNSTKIKPKKPNLDCIIY